MDSWRAYLHLDMRVQMFWVWALVPARQHHATQTTSEAAALRVWHCLSHAWFVPALADHRKDGTGPEMSVISNQAKKTPTHLCSTRKATKKTAWWSRWLPRSTHCCAEMHPKSDITAALQLILSAVTLLVQPCHSPDLAAEGELLSWTLVVTQFTFSAGMRLPASASDMQDGMESSLPLFIAPL